jgi:hypothetical protein
MAAFDQRVVYTNGTASYLMEGDPEQNDERFFFTRVQGRLGCALPQLMSEGWQIVSVTAVSRGVSDSSRGANDNFGATLVVLQRPSGEAPSPARYGSTQ